MQIFTRELDVEDAMPMLRHHLDPEKTAFTDIETTGLNPAYDSIYMIGCAVCGKQGFSLTQWFDDTGREEEGILRSFLYFIREKQVLVHYNGSQFDLPFIERRMRRHGMEGSLSLMEGKKSIDLLQAVRPYRRLLGLANVRQQTVEERLGTGREESESGKDLTKVYDAWLKTGEDGAGAETLQNHNAADVEGLIRTACVLSIPTLLQAQVKAHRAEASRYRGPDGTIREEIVMHCSLIGVSPELWNHKITASADECYISLQGCSLTVKVPLYTGERKYFYANYQDYYYLPQQDQALHKSIASFVEKDRRIQAKAETCYTRKTGSFLPQWDLFRTPFFKENYKDKTILFEFLPEMKKDQQFFSDYAAYVYRHITESPGN